MEHATCWKDYDHCEDIFMKGKWKVFVVGMKSGWGGGVIAPLLYRRHSRARPVWSKRGSLPPLIIVPLKTAAIMRLSSVRGMA